MSVPRSIHSTPHSSDPTSRDIGSKSSGGGFRHWLRSRFHLWQAHRMTVELHRLDDRMLSDIGLRRSDISRMVHDLGHRGCPAVPVVDLSDAPSADGEQRRLAA